jgi:hypothetical protein
MKLNDFSAATPRKPEVGDDYQASHAAKRPRKQAKPRTKKGAGNTPYRQRLAAIKEITMLTLNFADIAARAGFLPEASGKLNLPATQQTADALARAAIELVGGPWQPGMSRIEATLTGAGPVWGYLAIAHALHGRVTKLVYAAPNAEITVFGHGA